jgi:hypothetical protein
VAEGAPPSLFTPTVPIESVLFDLSPMPFFGISPQARKKGKFRYPFMYYCFDEKQNQNTNPNQSIVHYSLLLLGERSQVVELPISIIG